MSSNISKILTEISNFLPVHLKPVLELWVIIEQRLDSNVIGELYRFV